MEVVAFDYDDDDHADWDDEDDEDEDEEVEGEVCPECSAYVEECCCGFGEDYEDDWEVDDD